MSVIKPEILNKTPMAMKPVVTVWCVVFNHSSWLEQCLDGIASQKTDFDFEILIHDDCSSDDSADIIRRFQARYPEKTVAVIQHQNQYSQGDHAVSKFMMSLTRGQFIAYCEGDDYWTDPLKLQKQVDVFRSNPALGMVYTRARRFYQNTATLTPPYGGNAINFRSLLMANTVPTLTVMVKKRILLRYFREISPSGRGWKMGDYPLILWTAAKSRIAFINDVTGVYRVLDNSASHSADPEKEEAFKNSYFDIKDHFAKLFLPEMVARLEEMRNDSLMRLAFASGNLKKTGYYYSLLRKPSLKARLRRIVASSRPLWHLFGKKMVND